MPKLYQHNETGRLTWCDDCPGDRWAPVPTMCQCELPGVMESDKYDFWLQHSILMEGCVHGPLLSFGRVH